MRHFKSPKRSIGDLDADVAARLVAQSADLALVVDAKGVVRDVACSTEALTAEDYAGWVGKSWIDIVTVESRAKIEELLRDAATSATAVRPRWRQVNHPTPRGDQPISYSTIRLSGGRTIAVGRELKAMATLQQRLVDAQQSLEREYQRLRQAEMRYRALFEMSADAIIVVDAATTRIVECNPAATTLLANGSQRLIGRDLFELFNAEGQQAIRGLFAAARVQPRAEVVSARQLAADREFTVAASHFRQEDGTYFLVQLDPVARDEGAGDTARSRSLMLRAIEKLPDALVVIDADRRVLTSNAAFLELTQLASSSQAKGEPLERWLGRAGVDVDVLIANLKEHGSVRRFATILRGEFGSTEDVEISAVSVRTGAGAVCYGLALRRIERPSVTASAQAGGLPRSVEQMAGLVGRVPLKTLVRETTDIIERMCIEAALELTDDNRASAAEMLGLSRQSFYSKLRRHVPGAVDDGEGDGA